MPMVDREVPISAKLGGSAEVVVKGKVQAKLEEYLPTATDSVLCDYVLVMVGNKKTSRQVALDLEAFLGPEEAEQFVAWLWDLLESVENKTLELSGQALGSGRAPEPRRDERRSRSPIRRRSRSRSRDRGGGARSRSRDRDNRHGGRRGRGDDFRRDDFRRRDQDTERDYSRGMQSEVGRAGGVDRRGLREPITSRLLMNAVKAQGQVPRAPPVRDHAPGEGGMRSDAILEETRKHLLHRQQQELKDKKEELGRGNVAGFGNAAGDLRNTLGKGGKRPAGFGSGISSRLGPFGPFGAEKVAGGNKEEEAEKTQEEEEADADEETVSGEAGDDVEFNVTMPAAALMAGQEEGWDGEGWQDEGGDADGYYISGDAGFRGRGRGRGGWRGGFRGRGGGFAPGVRGRGGFKPVRGGIRGRGRGGASGETFAAKKWVNPALVAASKAATGGAEAAGGAAAEAKDAAAATTTAAAAGTGGSLDKKAKDAFRPVVGTLNLDGDLSTVGKRGLYKAQKWVKAA